MSIKDLFKRIDSAEHEVEKTAQQANGEEAAPELKARITEALRQVYDPEIPVNIYDLGLIYRLEVDKDGKVDIDMTLTAPGCPVAQTFPGTLEGAVKAVEGVSDAHVELVWDPPWTPERMSEAARLQLGFM